MVKIDSSKDDMLNTLHVHPTLLYTNASLTRNLLKASKIEHTNLEIVDSVCFLYLGQNFHSIYDKKDFFRKPDNIIKLDDLNESLVCTNRDWVEFLKEMLEIFCQDEKSKKVFLNSLNSLSFIWKYTFRDINTCPIVSFKAVKINKKYNGSIYMHEFLMKFISICTYIRFEYQFDVMP